MFLNKVVPLTESSRSAHKATEKGPSPLYLGFVYYCSVLILLR